MIVHFFACSFSLPRSLFCIFFVAVLTLFLNYSFILVHVFSVSQSTACSAECPEGAYSISPGTDLIESGLNDAISKGIYHIHLEPGIHTMTKTLTIETQMTFSGGGRGITIVQEHGFWILGKKDEKCTFMDMSVQKTKDSGLVGQNGMHFDCLRVHFDQCGGDGVRAYMTNGKLINCQITQCLLSGVVSYQNSAIEIEGEDTMIENNNTDEDIGDCDPYNFSYPPAYGLKASYLSSSIHILSPLTKESIKNNQYGNYGGYGEIAIIDNDGNKIEIIQTHSNVHVAPVK
jgi:hypothetical protein